MSTSQEPNRLDVEATANSLVWAGWIAFWGSIALAASRAGAFATPLTLGGAITQVFWMVLILLIGNTIRAALIGFAALLTTLARPRIEPEAATGPTASALRAEQLAECHRAIRGGQWAEAEASVQAFRDAHPDDADSARLAEELTGAKDAARREIMARVDAARQAGDPDRVIELREGLKVLIDIDALKDLDRDLARWFMTIIQRRLRAGTVRPDVAQLAGRVAENLDDTPEGASLRASLPTLRRAAGLCARCAQPYKGIADACPACLGGGGGAGSTFTSEGHDEETETL